MFDEDYFCYAEDTDVCIRSRLLGYSAEYVDMTAALHDGQASSGGGFSDFVLYHGIRNSIWTMVKSIPLRSILLNLPFIVALHLGIIIRHSLKGKVGVIVRLYVDTLRALPRMLNKRKVVQATRRIHSRDFNEFITPKFYESNFLKMAIRDLFRFAR